jgi:cytochrome c oxidase subunit 3
MSTGKTGTYHHHHAHHFDSDEHEYSTAKLGIWSFLLTEILMFGGLFVGYVIYHGKNPAMFHAGSTFLDWKLGALNTIVLLVSSLTMALSIYYAQHNNKAKTLLNLYITLGCAATFMAVKAFEYHHKFELGLLPGALFHYTGPEATAFPNLAQYFSFYFLMTGLHGTHVLAGMGFIIWLIIRTHKGQFSSEYWTPLECVGLFWHLVDLIWIYLFPLLYLIG